jgi:transcriptional regulator NrdR family protein
MKCPTCNTWTSVLESVLRRDGSRRRRYQCANLHRFNTEERIVGLSSTATEVAPSSSTAQYENPNTNKPLK